MAADAWDQELGSTWAENIRGCSGLKFGSSSAPGRLPGSAATPCVIKGWFLGAKLLVGELRSNLERHMCLISRNSIANYLGILGLKELKAFKSCT